MISLSKKVFWLNFTFAVLILIATSSQAFAPQLIRVENCKIKDIDVPLRCAYYEVPENWEAPEVRTIRLRAVILPSAEQNPNKKAMFHIEGGPGISSVDAGLRFYATDGRDYWKNEDVVLFEQRGTGESNPLGCPALENRSSAEEMYPPKIVAECREELEKKADLTQYNSGNAARDLEAIRNLLNYGKIDLWAQSYGTRVALLYIAGYSQNVRSAALQGTVATNAKLPLYHARYAESVLQRVFQQCRDDPECNKNYPDVTDEWRQFLLKVPEAERGIVADAVRRRLYSADNLRRLPYLVHELFHQGSLLEEFRRNESARLMEGAYLSITCTEDVPFITDTEEKKETANTSFGNYRIEQQKKACSQWFPKPPKTQLFQAVKSTVPVLFLVGTLDVVTPKECSMERSESLPNSRIIEIPEMGHSIGGLSHMDCYDRITLDFLDKGDTRKIDISCLSLMKPSTFFLGK